MEMVQCEFCHAYTCCPCVDISTAQYQTVHRDDLLWICGPSCGDQVQKAIISWRIKMTENNDSTDKLTHNYLDEQQKSNNARINKMEEAMSETVTVIKEIASKLDNVEQTLSDLKKDTSSNNADQDDSIWSTRIHGIKDTMTESVNIIKTLATENQNKQASTPSMRVIMQEAMEEKEKEDQGRQERANNIVIFSAKESQDKDREKRREDDQKFVKGFIEYICDSQTVSVDKVARLGMREAGKNRPIRITFSSLEGKSRVLSNLSNLRDAPDEFANITVRHDLTPRQQEDFKKLVKIADEKTEALEDDKYHFRVRSLGPHWDPKVVKLKKRNPKMDHN